MGRLARLRNSLDDHGKHLAPPPYEAPPRCFYKSSVSATFRSHFGSSPQKTDTCLLGRPLSVAALNQAPP